MQDEGPGISPEDQKKLFSAFFQINPEEAQKGEGSGVGLSICKQLVEFHGGTIHCDSTVGIGSTFSFVIPFKVTESYLGRSIDGCESRNTAANPAAANIPCDRRISGYTPLSSLVFVPSRILVVDGKCNDKNIISIHVVSNNNSFM